ncbi:MAG: hypothetical protein LBP28_03560, partial [Coriobacteriales bacterium]|nr:hypothetical protein [Coriobacteriales bacterium]
MRARADARLTLTPDADKLQAARLMFSPKIRLAVKIIIVTALFAAFLVSFMIGRYPVMPAELVQIVWAHFFDPDSLFASKADTAIFNI